MSTYLNRRKIRLERSKPIGVLCFLGRFYGPAKFKQALYGTAKGVPTGWVGLAPLDGGEIAVDWVPEGTSGAVKVAPGPGEYTCEFHFGAVLAWYPNLEVEPGWAFEFPFRVEAGRLILSIKAGKYRPSEPYEQKIRRWRRREGMGDGRDQADHP